MTTPAGPRPRDFAVARTTNDLDQVIDVETPEQVVFSYTIAGVGSRAAAAILDVLVLTITFLILAIVVNVAGGAFFSRRTSNVSGAWIVALIIIMWFVALWGYFVLFEALWDGQTPGKRHLGLRVVQDGGYAVTFAASAVRNLVRAIDMQPGLTYAVGMVSAMVSKSGKRLGDLMAGTIVVREAVTHVPVAAQGIVATGDPAAAPVATLLTDEEYAVLERYVVRRQTLAPDRRAEFAQRLAERFRPRAPGIDGNDPAFVVQLFERERSARSRGVAAHAATGAGRAHHAIVAEGAARWSDFAKRLERARAMGLRHMPEDEVSEFVGRYRELATDLARLQTAAGGRDLDTVFYLSRLVAGGHNLLYRGTPVGWAAVWRYLGVTVPRELRRSWRPIALSAFLIFAPAAAAWIAVVRHPEMVGALVPPSMIDRAEQGVNWAKNEQGYIRDDPDAHPVMAGAIMTNNIQVAIMAFASGVTFGAGTVYVLVYNGISLGAVMGLYQSKGILSLIVRFVAPHGVLEMTAIAIAGGAGLLLAAALLLPGARTRREAFVLNGRRAVRLVAGAAFLLVIAGSLEGFVSPIPWWPLWWKLGVSAVTAVFLAGYLGLGRGEPDAPAETYAYSDARALISR
jgi:uncharacterized membrane protein SpoIIM required for sporulation/uncharacterized RDD family membrane protein YckC